MAVGKVSYQKFSFNFDFIYDFISIFLGAYLCACAQKVEDYQQKKIERQNIFFFFLVIFY